MGNRFGINIIDTEMKRINTICFAALIAAMTASARSTNEVDTVALENMKNTFISVLSFTNTYDRYDQMIKKYKIADRDTFLVQIYLMECEHAKLRCNFDYLSDRKRRGEAKEKIESAYRDSIYRLLIPYNNNISGENLSLALRIHKHLELDSIQCEYIMDKALDLAHRLDKSPTLNVWNEEMETLQKTLDEKQLYLFFKSKYFDKIKKEVAMYWDTIVEAGLEEELDSASDCARACRYLHRLYMINDLHRHNGQQRHKLTAETKQIKPSLVKMYETIIRRKQEKE